jgi:anthranilate phosphoribosyltransferase
MIKETIRKLTERRDLTADEAAQAMAEIMTGEATPAQVAGFIVALRMKGETVEEISGCARVMRAKARPIACAPARWEAVDTCGTGGDARGTFNISTASAIVAAGAGVTVAKHGNRAVSSHSGSADVLKQLGVNIEAPPAVVERCLAEARIGFLFAPLLHEAMKFAIGPRRELGVRTVFNILGPLTNPAGARCQVLGVYDKALPPVMAGVLRSLGSKRCMVVHGDDGLDEITTTGRTLVAELRDGAISTYDIGPGDFGLPTARLADLVVHSIEEAAAAVRSVLAGEPGPRRDIVLLNAGAAIAVSGAAKDLPQGIRLAAKSIDSGAARQTLERLAAVSNAGAERGT